MNVSRRKLLAVLAAAGASLRAYAADFPSRSIKIVVPFTPGGPGDILARVLGEIMGKNLGQPVIVENKPGANQMLAAAAVVQAPADGYTLYQATSTAVLSPLLYKKLAYDPKSIKPLWLGLEMPVIFVVNPRLPVKTLQEFVAYAKRNDGKVNYSSIGPGNVLHLSMEKFKKVGGFEITHVPYAGRSADALNAVLSGEVEIMATLVSQVTSLVQAGKLRALAVTSDQRLPILPDIATAKESGFPSLTVSSWYGLYINSATDERIADQLRSAADLALLDPGFQKRFTDTGAVVLMPRTGAEVRRYVENNAQYWAEIINDQNISLD